MKDEKPYVKFPFFESMHDSRKFRGRSSDFKVFPCQFRDFDVKPIKNPKQDDISVLDTFQVRPVSRVRDLRSNSQQTDGNWLEKLRARIRKELSKLPPTPFYEEKLSREHQLDDALRLRRTVLTRPALPKDCVNMLRKLNKEDPDKVVISKFNIDFTVKDLNRLMGANWLNDECINFYLQLLTERSQKFPSTLPSVHVFSTFFLPKLQERGYDFVKTSTKRIQPSVLSRDLILVPVHLGMHWCMSVIDFRQKTIFYYDSLLGPDRGCIDALRTWLEGEGLDKLGKSFDFGGWRSEVSRTIPVQLNGHDCGVFSLIFAEHHCRRAPFNFSQADIPYWRSRISYEIITGSILE